MEERGGRKQEARWIKRQIEWVDGREDEVKLILFVSINVEKKKRTGSPKIHSLGSDFLALLIKLPTFNKERLWAYHNMYTFWNTSIWCG